MRKEVHRVIEGAVKRGLEEIALEMELEQYITREYDYPVISHFGNGLPSYSFGYSDNSPKKYSSLIDKDRRIGRFAEVEEFVDLVGNSEELQRYFHSIDVSDSKGRDEIKHVISNILKDMIDACIASKASLKFDEIVFLPIYSLWENRVFNDKLDFKIIVPLVFVDSDFGNEIASDASRIFKISEALQLSLAAKYKFRQGEENTVRGAVLYAADFGMWNTSNVAWLDVYNRFERGSFYAEIKSKIDLYFSCIKVITGKSVGYGEIVAVPQGWGPPEVQDIKPVYSYHLREFPEEFAKHGWYNDPIKITEEKFIRAENLFNIIVNEDDHRLFIACRRFNSLFLRNNEEDAIIDIAIGLEVLLCSDSRTEIAYRLANRLALLSKIADVSPFTPSEMRYLCKKMYDYRSRIIHGDKNYEKYKTINFRGDKVAITSISLEILRFVIKFTSLNRQYSDVDAIDDIAFSKS